MEWIYTENQLPLCYETGDWDGKRSNLVIGETFYGKQFLGCCYSGFMDGCEFFDWYQVDEINGNDWMVSDTVVRWLKIPL
jgi:hypothetical protein